MTVFEAIETYLIDCRARNLRPASLKTYERQLYDFAAYAETADAAQMAHIDVQVVRGYLASLLARGLSPNSARTHARSLRAFLNFAVADELIADSPMRRVRLPKADKKQPDAFTPQEVQKLIAAARTVRDRAIVLCLLDTGCRIGEFTALTIGDVNMATGAVNVEHTKGRRSRTVYLGQASRAALAAYLGEWWYVDSTPLWRTEASGVLVGITVEGMKRAIQRIGQRAGVKPAGPHKYRRTFATWSLRAGMDLFHLKDLMGHSTIDLLKHYVSMSDEALQAAHVQYGPVDHMKSLFFATDNQALSE